MARFIVTLAALDGLAYGGLYFYFGVEIKRARDQRLGDIRVIGQPVFSEETRLELDSLQALRLTIGAGG